MTTPNTIVSHLQTYLPIFTDAFSTLATVSAAAGEALNIVRVTATAHGLSTSDVVTVGSGTVRNTVSNVVVNGDGTATITTDYDHDLITPSQVNDQQTIVLTGFTPSAWNYEATIIEKIDGTTLKISTSETSGPSVNGYFPGPRNILGFRTVTVVDVNTFTYQVTGLQIPVAPIDNVTIATGFRIYSAATIQMAEATYTSKQTGKMALYVIMSDVDVSKSREATSDMISGFTAQDYQLLRTMTNFETVVFFPADTDLAGSVAIEAAYGEIYTSLLPVFQGFGFQEQGERIPYLTGTAGHGPGESTRAYYQHVYSWQSPSAITVQDGFSVKIGPITSAFKQIDQTWNLNNDTEAQLTATNTLR